MRCRGQAPFSPASLHRLAQRTIGRTKLNGAYTIHILDILAAHARRDRQCQDEGPQGFSASRPKRSFCEFAFRCYNLADFHAVGSQLLEDTPAVCEPACNSAPVMECTPASGQVRVWI
jgi:hypothetical protein